MGESHRGVRFPWQDTVNEGAFETIWALSNIVLFLFHMVPLVTCRQRLLKSSVVLLKVNITLWFTHEDVCV